MSEIPEKQIKRLRSLITDAETNLSAAKELLSSIVGDDEITSIAPAASEPSADGRVVEGVFDGQIMIDQDGKNYPVPANYASKSKLVEGDILKLTISSDGRFLYKQIGPVERRTVVGTLVHHDDKYFAKVDDREYEVLYASVTYFHLHEGSKVAVIIPAENDKASWAAIEAAI